MINPACTPGEAENAGDGTVVARCGCGWQQSGFPSRAAAFRAQKRHRFPPRNALDPDPLPNVRPDYTGPLAVPSSAR